MSIYFLKSAYIGAKEAFTHQKTTKKEITEDYYSSKKSTFAPRNESDYSM